MIYRLKALYLWKEMYTMGKTELNGYDKEFFFRKLRRGVRPSILCALYDISEEVMSALLEASKIEPVRNESE